MIKALILSIIHLYHRTLSPDHGWFSPVYPYGRCRFYPSCSEYAIGTIEKRGVLWGGLLAVSRVLRCNPWSKGGIDLVK